MSDDTSSGLTGGGLPGTGGFSDLYQGGFNAYDKQPAPTGDGRDVTNLVIVDLAEPKLIDTVRGWRAASLYEMYFNMIAIVTELRLQLSMTQLGDGLTPDDPQRVLHAVIMDLNRRAIGGEKKYGTRLKTHNGRSATLDAYQEVLDAMCYVRQKIEEIEDV